MWRFVLSFRSHFIYFQHVCLWYTKWKPLSGRSIPVKRLKLVAFGSIQMEDKKDCKKWVTDFQWYGLFQIPFARSDAHLNEIFDGICEKSKDYKLVVNSLTGKAVFAHNDATYLKDIKKPGVLSRLHDSVSHLSLYFIIYFSVTILLIHMRRMWWNF